MKAIKYLSVILALMLVLIPATVVAATQYAPEESGTLYAEVKDGAGEPVTNATVTVDLYDTDGNLEIDGGSMSHVANGVYKYDFTAPTGEGVYFVVSDAGEYGHSTTEIHVKSPSGSAGDIWGEDMTTYTDGDTFGGSYSTNFGGEMMLLILYAGMALVFMTLFFWKKSQMAAYGAAGIWLLLGIQAYVASDSPDPAHIQDTYMGLFWLGMVFVIACIFLPLVMREKASKDDLYVDEVDEVTGEKIIKPTAEELQRKANRRARLNRSPEARALNRLNRTGKV